MKGIKPPFIELGFYFHDTSEREALARIVEACVALGAKPNLYPVEGIGDRLRNAQPALSGIGIQNAVGTVRDASESIELFPRTQDRIPLPPCSVVISTDGSKCGIPIEYMSGAEKQRALRTLKVSFDRFCQLVERTYSTYAGLAFENELPTPRELAEAKMPDLRFDPFYVGKAAFHPNRLNAIKRLYENGNVREFAQGVLLSFYKKGWWDGTQRVDSDEIYRRSQELARLIVKQFT